MWIDPWEWSCSSDAKKLRESMRLAGRPEPAYKNSAHHIVMSGSKDWRMVTLRQKMDNLGVDINFHRNGVFLPRTSAIKNAARTDAHAHSVVHSDKYKQNIYDRLIDKDSQSSFIAELTVISKALENGTLGI